MLVDKSLAQDAIELAKKWQNKADELASNFDQKFNKQIQKMLANPMDKVLLIELMDQCFRSKNNKRVADQINFLFDKYGMADFFTSGERFLVFMFRNAGVYLPDISVPLFVKKVREDTKTVVIKGEEDVFNAHLEKRRENGDRVNVNLIGEVVLGEEEAEDRIEKYLKLLENPNVDYISIKISTIFSQINALSFENTIEELVERLSRIYRQAKKYSFIGKNGKSQNKFINLDMEEYRDLGITYHAFTRALDRDEFKDFYAGIVLQAYLPDSHLWQKKLVTWAKQRVENGGSPIKMRLVKGANMEMEETESSQRDWPIAPYTKKIDTDANYKVMIHYALQPDHAKFVHVGSASHNLFELAYAYTLAKHNDVLEYYTLEMLEGMSESATKAINEYLDEQNHPHVLLYAPTAAAEQFTNAIAYLVRRLDENTGVENFIRYSFGLKVDSHDWKAQESKFLDSIEHAGKNFIGVKRTQNRLNEDWSKYKGGSFHTGEFKNEPDTDFVLEPNKQWAKEIVKKWKKDKDFTPEPTPVVVNGKDFYKSRDVVEVKDKSQLKEGIICGAYTKANTRDLQKAVEVAAEDKDGWRDLSHEERHKVLSKVANLVRQRRGDLIGIAAAEVGKVFTQTDVEVSEAVDFLEFYPHSVRYFQREGLEFRGKGVGLVTPPWNFPIAIPLGGIAAVLASGNTAIMKPASSAVLCAYELCKCFWDAGISKNTLQFVPCSGSEAGKHLVSNEKVDFVILTGGEDTAMNMLSSRPNLFLTAETGGKDATIVTALSDREQAIKNVVNSAFSNSGQKCSATSLLVLEDEIYDDENFKKSLIDAAKSLHVGSVWDFKNILGTLANPVGGNLKHALENLEEGESWALKPEYAHENEYMLKPAIKWGVQKKSFCHMNELFGPVLSVMRASDLEDAIKIVNMTGYGLTSGIESLDAREIEVWKEKLRAGNLYINRGTTGAIVLRQPFGGMGKSAIGAGRKVGVFNYVTQFMDFTESSSPAVKKEYYHKLIPLIKQWLKDADNGIHREFLEDFGKLELALQSYVYNYKTEFDAEHDYCNIRGEDNIFRYIPLKKVALRVLEDDSLFEILSRIIATKVSKVSLHVSVDASANSNAISFLFENKDSIFDKEDVLLRENEESFVSSAQDTQRVLYAKIEKVSDYVYEQMSKIPIFIVRHQPFMDGRLELLNYFEEQSVSHSYHRYGNLGARGI
ncbi:MAG: aldehyde dehydrogenase [Proteobacteria bacterium]|nr:MAG: aldehyde dehydrogenase [Pseudomonadota bacterium]